MNHLNEEQLVLYYYGETTPDPNVDQNVEKHLGECEECRSAYHALQRVLNSVDSLPVPDRPADYEAQVWRSIEGSLPRRRSFMPRWLSWRPMLAAAAMAALLVGAFFAGRIERGKKVTGVATSGDSQVRERVLLVAVGDHLQRSQSVLVELANAGTAGSGHLDISYEQRRAEDLLEENRLYRQTATSAGDDNTASMLDELERVLLEIAHSPSNVSEKQLDGLRKQIEDRGIIFKVKVFGKQVEERESAPAPASGTSL